MSAPAIDFDRSTPPSPPEWEGLEYGFWQARPELETIYSAAIGRMTSPWAVFASVVARVLTLVPPTVTLPPVVGGRGCLNWFAALAGDSGAGKSAAHAVAAELAPGAYTSNVGSAEGMIKLFQPEPDGVQRTAVYFEVDEIDGLAAQANRGGSALMPMLKSAWTAKKLTLAYKTVTPKDVIDDHEYRLTLTCAVQPERAATILRETSGIAQRFMWFPAWDDRIAEEYYTHQGGHIAPLALPSAAKDADWRYGCELTLDDHITSDIVEARLARDCPHSMFAQLKVAYALAALDGRTRMNNQDWDLASIVIDVSDFTRVWVSDCLEWHEAQESGRRGKQHGLQQAAAADTRADIAEAQHDKTCAWIARKLGAGAMNIREMNRAAPSTKHKRALRDALTAMQAAGQVDYDGNDPLAHGARWFLKAEQ